MALNTPEELIADIRAGKMVILMDDEDRENEGDLIMAAECVQAEHINFMAQHARGLICLTLTEERCDLLQLPPMVQRNDSPYHTNFTLSIEAAEGVTTGISAGDRAHTVRVAVKRNAKASDIIQPGHIFPLRAQKGGVLTRAGHTEAGCDLARLAGFEPASVICEILNADGTMARRPELEIVAKNHGLKIGTIADLINYRVLTEKTVEFIDEAAISTEYGDFLLQRYRDTLFERVHFVLIKGNPNPEDAILTRVHVPDTVRDLMLTDIPGNVKGWNMHRAMRAIAEEGCGVIVLITQADSIDDVIFSSDIAMGHKVLPRNRRAGQTEINLNIGLGSQLLREAGVRKMRLMSSPVKYNAISGFDLEVVEYIPYQETE